MILGVLGMLTGPICNAPLLSAALASFIYCFGLLIQRLILSPIANFPGPKFAAATFWYEFYYDVVKSGTYFGEIAKMHQQYGEYIG